MALDNGFCLLESNDYVVANPIINLSYFKQTVFGKLNQVQDTACLRNALNVMSCVLLLLLMSVYIVCSVVDTENVKMRLFSSL